MGARFVGSRNEKSFAFGACFSYFPEGFCGVYNVLYSCWVASGTDYDKVVVHHSDSVNAVAFSYKGFFQFSRMHQDDVSVASLRYFDGLTCAYGNRVDFNIEFSFKHGNQRVK